ncbi:MAG: hypothetical protein WDZ41_03920 [Candidatus Babeliales bacterium]
MKKIIKILFACMFLLNGQVSAHFLENFKITHFLGIIKIFSRDNNQNMKFENQEEASNFNCKNTFFNWCKHKFNIVGEFIFHRFIPVSRKNVLQKVEDLHIKFEEQRKGVRNEMENGFVAFEKRVGNIEEFITMCKVKLNDNDIQLSGIIKKLELTNGKLSQLKDNKSLNKENCQKVNEDIVKIKDTLTDYIKDLKTIINKQPQNNNNQYISDIEKPD